MRRSLFSGVVVGLVILSVLATVASFTYAESCKCVPTTCLGAPVCRMESGGPGYTCNGCEKYDVGPCAKGTSSSQTCENATSEVTCGGRVIGHQVYVFSVGWTCMGCCTESVGLAPCGGTKAYNTGWPCI